jgi:hypothetical protein
MMTAHSISQTSTNARLAIRRYRWWLILSLVLVVATLSVYRSVSIPGASGPLLTTTQWTTFVNPVQQSVFDYLRAHSANQLLPALSAPLDPAQQSVMHYLHAHDRGNRSPAFPDQVTQAVLDYLRAHSQ